MEARKKIRFGDLLLMKGLITEAQLLMALESQKVTGKKIGEVLVDLNFVTEEMVAETLAKKLGLQYVDLKNNVVDANVLSLVPKSMLKKNVIFPYGYSPYNPGVIRLAMADPMDMDAQEDVELITNYRVEVVVATTRSIMLAIDEYCADEEMDSALVALSKEKQMSEEEELAADDVNSSPVVMLVKEMIEKAVRQRSSDIHIEAMERKVRVRYRIDGTLYERARYDLPLLAAIVARIKIVGGMDIAEKRKPQDGRVTQIVDNVEYDIRVSILPTVHGEKVVMRLTSKMALTREKSKLGLKPKELEAFDHILKNPHGILLVTGPTGSGKSTTLYTALSELNNENVNIVTVEDPVEANLDGVNQVHVNNKAGLTFASSLRSILRQDPDIIMIGEIRDQETASIAVQASITGHLVVSTLHTNSATNTITRLEDMGIESYLIADSVVGIIAQRLVRRLCPSCKKPRMATDEEKRFMDINTEEEVTIYEPCGCGQCDDIGYRGRIGVYEILKMTPKLKTIIGKKMGVDAIKEQAVMDGMRTLRQSAAEYVLDGTTSYEEMVKVSFDI